MVLEHRGSGAHVDPSTRRNSRLRQVAFVSRHGVRSPLPSEIDYMTPFTTHPWPEWEAPPACLTPHAETLAENLGAWYGEHYHPLLGSRDRPPADWMYVSADSLERCVTTARCWLKGFLNTQDPQIGVEHREIDENRTEYDPLYLPVEAGMVQVHGAGEAVRGQIGDDLWGAIRSLSGPLSLVQKALGGAVFSPELYGIKNEVLDDGTITGTLELGQMASDIFVLQHANGWPIEKVAWGRVSARDLLDIERARIFADNIICRSPAYARADASNRAAHILTGFHQHIDDDPIPGLPFSPEKRMVAYFGHDTNIQTLGGLLRISWLPESFVQDQTPPACALVFELHQDLDTKEHFVRLWFVTAKLEQMTTAATLTALDPPARGPIGLPHTRELKTALDVPFEEFDQVIREVIALAGVKAEIAAWIESGPRTK
jgi:4-phytase/acid phosphatase